MKILIIGGVAGGASAAARLRRLDEQAEIIMLERGSYISYANCGLPYYIGGEIREKSALTLQTPESFYARFAVDVRTRHEVLTIDTDGKTVQVRDLNSEEVYTESYDKLILSPGAEPLRPAIPGVDDERIFTLRTIPDTYRIQEYIRKKKPRTALVVGGGYIGLEMAENLTRLGLSVTVAEQSDHVIAPLDYDISCEVHRYIKQNGIHLLLNNGVRAFIPNKECLDVELDNGSIQADMVLLSIGVRPETNLAKTAGLALNDRQAIIVNEQLRTSNDDIYAIGDAVQVKNRISGKDTYIPLAGPANKQGRIAAKNVLGGNAVYHGTIGSSILKLFDMTVAATGLNEQTAKAAKISYESVYLASPSHATYYPGATIMSVKVLFEKESGQILGAQIVGGGGADKRIDVFAAAICQKANAADLANLELAYAPPYSSAKDPVNMAGFVIENILDGLVKQFYWQQVEELIDNKDVQLLDTRFPVEFFEGHIASAVHIPVDDLRQRIGELDPGKPVYVYCQSGQRSYIACRILTQNGFNCFNLSGGYRLYSSVMKENHTHSAIEKPCCSK